MRLPQFQSDDQNMQLMQNRWAALIEPPLSQPIIQGVLLKDVSLDAGANVINHRLGRALQGWLVVRQRAAAQLYDTQDDNTRPNLTLLLTSSAPVSVDIWVF